MDDFLLCGSISPNTTQGQSDSESIQNAVDKAHESGLNCVVIPRYNQRTDSNVWTIDKAIRLPSEMTVVLDNCFMVMADDAYSNFFINSNAYLPISLKQEGRQHHISIIGRGNATLDGGKPNDLTEKTSGQNGHFVMENSPILFINVEYFSVENISITNQRYWGMRFQFCARGSIRNIFTNVTRDRPNQDGINLRNGCHDIIIEHVHGQTGDDMIALSAIDTEVCANDFGKVIVEGLSHDIHDVTIRDISGFAIGHPLVALRNHNGAKIYNITIDTVRDTPMLQHANYEDEERYGIIRIGNNSYFSERPSEIGETYNISINNVFVNHSKRGIVIMATLKNSRFTNIHAGGSCKSVVAVTDLYSKVKGAQLENISVSGVTYSPESREGTQLFDFSVMRPTDYVKNLTLTDALLENVGALFTLAEDCTSFSFTHSNVTTLYTEKTE